MICIQGIFRDHADQPLPLQYAGSGLHKTPFNLGLNNMSGQPVPVCHHSPNEEFIPYI